MLLLIASATGVEPEPGFELELELLDLDADGIVAGGALAGGGSILECVYVCGRDGECDSDKDKGRPSPGAHSVDNSGTDELRVVLRGSAALAPGSSS